MKSFKARIEDGETVHIRASDATSKSLHVAGSTCSCRVWRVKRLPKVNENVPHLEIECYQCGATVEGRLHWVLESPELEVPRGFIPEVEGAL